MNTKICKKCGDTSHYAFGLCRKCYRTTINYPKSREKILEGKRRHYRKHKAEVNKKHKERYHNGNSNTIRVATCNGRLFWCCGNGKPLHRVIAEQVMDRRLKRREVVHHLDGNGLNNAHDNLLICTRSFHTYLHRRMTALQGG